MDLSNLVPKPAHRRLRVFAFDPQASMELETAVINNATIELPWESAWEDDLTKGPTNEYIEVVDYDPASGCFYPPVDLNHSSLLAECGLAPSDGNPQFHQQMVFAVAMKVIREFERALGRSVLFMREKPGPPEDPIAFRQPVRRLRIYPHAMREPNAYYSPQKASLLFGYFRGRPARDGTGGGWVFTCLSQDIVAHETTHAVLHGMWPRSVEASNSDSLAFHEAFADVVALLQHFAVPAVVRHEMARYGGSLRSVGLLNGLGQQFGRATGREGPLRFALQMVQDEEQALASGKSLAPDRNSAIVEPHSRGQILVAAVFDAFVTVFERRTADLFRLARWRRGDPENIPNDLADRLSAEAAHVAEHVLHLCIRGLDYLPPVDITFGEFLRAIVSADADLNPYDPDNYRVAFAEAFRKRGITVRGATFSSTDSLLWEPPEPFATPDVGIFRPGHVDADASFSEVLKDLQLGVEYDVKRIKHLADEAFKDSQVRPFRGAQAYSGNDPNQFVDRNLRDLSMMIAQYNKRTIWKWLVKPAEDDAEWERMLGIFLRSENAPRSIYRGDDGNPRVEVHSARISRRQTSDSRTLGQLIVQVAQRRRGYYSKADQDACEDGSMAESDPRWIKPDFTFRGGATLLVDLNDGQVRRIVRKRIDDDDRLARQRGYLLGDPDAFTFAGRLDPSDHEPFAFVHRSAR